MKRELHVFQLHKFALNILLLWQDSKGTFTESDIDSLLRDNKENVRFAQPIHSGSPVHTGDDL